MLRMLKYCKQLKESCFSKLTLGEKKGTLEKLERKRPKDTF